MSRALLIPLFAFLLIACEKDNGFQPDVITGQEPKTELRISVRHFYQFTPFVLDTGVVGATVYAFQNRAELNAFGSADLVRGTDSIGYANLGRVEDGWWYFRTEVAYLGQTIDSVFVSPGGGWQRYEIWYP